MIENNELKDEEIVDKNLDDEELVEIAVIEDPVFAEIISEALKDEGIEYTVVENQDTAYGLLYTTALGWGRLFVHKGDAEKAKAIFAEIVESYPVEESEDEEDENEER
jgi:hypothetical protein